jgi:hypothetical protein
MGPLRLSNAPGLSLSRRSATRLSPARLSCIGNPLSIVEDEHSTSVFQGFQQLWIGLADHLRNRRASEYRVRAGTRSFAVWRSFDATVVRP